MNPTVKGCIRKNVFSIQNYSRRQNKVPIAERLPSDFTATLRGSLTVKSLTNSLVERPLKRLYSNFSK